MLPVKFADRPERGANGHFRQCAQYCPVVAPAGGRTGIEDCHHTAIRFGADGTAKALTQLDLHFGHDLGLDVTVKIAVLRPQRFSQRIGHGERKPRDHKQRNHISWEIHSFPTGTAGEQDRIGQLFELLQIALCIAPQLQNG